MLFYINLQYNVTWLNIQYVPKIQCDVIEYTTRPKNTMWRGWIYNASQKYNVTWLNIQCVPKMQCDVVEYTMRPKNNETWKIWGLLEVIKRSFKQICKNPVWRACWISLESFNPVMPSLFLGANTPCLYYMLRKRKDDQKVFRFKNIIAR